MSRPISEDGDSAGDASVEGQGRHVWSMYKLVLSHHAIWLMVLLILTQQLSNVLTQHLLVKYEAEIPEAYVWQAWTSTTIEVAACLSGTMVVWMSEPGRLGRRGAFLYFAVLHIVHALASLALVNWQGGSVEFAISARGLTILLAFFGGRGHTYNAVLLVWLADETPVHAHAIGFGILALVHTIAAMAAKGAMVPVQPMLGLYGCYWGVLAAQLVQLLLVLLIPRDALDQREQDRHSQARTNPLYVAVDLWRAFGWMARNRWLVLVLIMSFSVFSESLHGDLTLYWVKEWGWDTNMLNEYRAADLLTANVMKFFLLPLYPALTYKGPALVFGTLALMGHGLLIAFSGSLALHVGFAGLEHFTWSFQPVFESLMVPGEDEDLPKGLLLANYNLFGLPARLLCAFVMSSCLTAEVDGARMCFVMPWDSFTGGGYVVMVLFLLPALAAALIWTRADFAEWSSAGGRMWDLAASAKPTGAVAEPPRAAELGANAAE